MRKELWHFFKLAWRQSLNYKSRASRKELGYYLLAVIAYTSVFIILLLASLGLAELAIQGQLVRTLVVPIMLISIAFACVMLVPLLSLIVRRGHDNHINGYLTLLIIGIFIALFIISFKNFQPAIIALQSIVFVTLLYIITKDNKPSLK